MGLDTRAHLPGPCPTRRLESSDRVSAGIRLSVLLPVSDPCILPSLTVEASVKAGQRGIVVLPVEIWPAQQPCRRDRDNASAESCQKRSRGATACAHYRA